MIHPQKSQPNFSWRLPPAPSAPMKAPVLLVLACVAASAGAFSPSARPFRTLRPATRALLRMGLFDDPVGWAKRGIEVMQDGRSVTASHILIPGPSAEQLTELKADCADLEAFSALAREYSTCPSGERAEASFVRSLITVRGVPRLIRHISPPQNQITHRVCAARRQEGRVPRHLHPRADGPAVRRRVLRRGEPARYPSRPDPDRLWQPPYLGPRAHRCVRQLRAGGGPRPTRLRRRLFSNHGPPLIHPRHSNFISAQRWI